MALHASARHWHMCMPACTQVTFQPTLHERNGQLQQRAANVLASGLLQMCWLAARRLGSLKGQFFMLVDPQQKCSCGGTQATSSSLVSGAPASVCHCHCPDCPKHKYQTAAVLRLAYHSILGSLDKYHPNCTARTPTCLSVTASVSKTNKSAP